MSADAPRQLLLLRHAKATTSDPGPAGEGNDHARDLAERGRHDASALGRVLRRLALRPDLVLTSSARRTVRTYELLGRLDGDPPAVTVSDRLYLAEPTELLAAIRAVPDSVRTLLLIGHNPGLHHLALLLAGEQAPSSLRAGLATCTLVRFTLDGAWSRVGDEIMTVQDQLRP